MLSISFIIFSVQGVLKICRGDDYCIGTVFLVQFLVIADPHCLMPGADDQSSGSGGCLADKFSSVLTSDHKAWVFEHVPY